MWEKGEKGKGERIGKKGKERLREGGRVGRKGGKKKWKKNELVQTELCVSQIYILCSPRSDGIWMKSLGDLVRFRWGHILALHGGICCLVARSCPTLCNPMDWKSKIWFSDWPTTITTWTVAHQASLTVGFLRLEYWSRLPFHSPGDLPDPGIKPVSPTLADGFFTTEPPKKSMMGLVPL